MFFVQTLGPAPGEPVRKGQKSAARGKPEAKGRSQPIQMKAPAKVEKPKKKGWFG